MDNNIYKLASKCLEIARSKIGVKTNKVLVRNIVFTDFDVSGEKEFFKRNVSELIIQIATKYPTIARELQEHVNNYEGGENIIHHSAIISILKCLKEIENPISCQNKRKIFISHSSKDKYIVSDFCDRILQLGIGLKTSDIFCTSIEDMNIKNGDDIRMHIKDNILSADFSFLLISCNYKKSEICLNEMGAVWTNGNNVRYYLLPNTDFKEIGWLCDTNQAEQLTNHTTLDKLYKELNNYYNLEDRLETWSKQREIFVNSIIKDPIEKSEERVSTLSKSIDEKLLEVLKSKPNQSLYDLAALLGLSTRETRIHLQQLQETNKIEAIGTTRLLKWKIKS